jgi:predicted ATP-grasp superfamily ATP-dependent carboligase
VDPIITVAVLGLLGTVIAALITWHAATSNARAERRNAAQEAADKALADAQAATQAEREELLGLRNKRLEEMANQLGSARQALAIARKENEALAAENEDLRRERHEPGGPS